MTEEEFNKYWFNYIFKNPDLDWNFKDICLNDYITWDIILLMTKLNFFILLFYFFILTHIIIKILFSKIIYK